MCSEADPLDCHRCLLVGRALAEAGIEVGHILASGEIVTHAQAEDRLLQLEHLAEDDLLMRSRRGAPGRSLSRPRPQGLLRQAASG